MKSKKNSWEPWVFWPIAIIITGGFVWLNVLPETFPLEAVSDVVQNPLVELVTGVISIFFGRKLQDKVIGSGLISIGIILICMAVTKSINLTW